MTTRTSKADMVRQFGPPLLAHFVAEYSTIAGAAAGAHLGELVSPLIEPLALELELAEAERKHRNRAAFVAELATKLVDSVVIPDDEEEARAMARKAVKMAAFVLDEALAVTEGKAP